MVCHSIGNWHLQSARNHKKKKKRNHLYCDWSLPFWMNVSQSQKCTKKPDREHDSVVLRYFTRKLGTHSFYFHLHIYLHVPPFSIPMYELALVCDCLLIVRIWMHFNHSYKCVSMCLWIAVMYQQQRHPMQFYIIINKSLAHNSDDSR